MFFITINLPGYEKLSSILSVSSSATVPNKKQNMKQHDFTGILPAQYTGKEIQAEACVELEDDDEAQEFYSVVKERLLNVNNWHELAGIISATFQLFDPNGDQAVRKPEVGDYVRIDIPGPGSKAGDGYDWVCIEDMKEVTEKDVQSIGFRVRPSKNPGGREDTLAHFYSDEASSCFIITREGSKVSAWIVDRNLSPNDEPESLTDKIRDTAIGISAVGLFSKIQWQHLAAGLIDRTGE